MSKKSLFFWFLIIFYSFLFADESNENEYDDVILYGNEKIELKQKKLNFLPEDSTDINLKENIKFDLSVQKTDSLQKKVATELGLSYNCYLLLGNKSNFGFGADILYKKSDFLLQNSTLFNHNNYDIKRNTLLVRNNGLFQPKAPWSIYYDFKFEKFNYNNAVGTNNFLSKTLFALKKKSYSVNLALTSVYLSEVAVNQAYLSGSFVKNFDKVAFTFNSIVGDEVFFLNSICSFEKLLPKIDSCSIGPIFYRGFDDNSGLINEKKSKNALDVEFNVIKNVEIKTKPFSFSLYRSFTYDTLYELYNSNKYFFNYFQNKKIYSETGISVKTFGKLYGFSYQLISGYSFLDNYMFFVNPADSPFFSLYAKDNALFRNELLCSKKFEYFDFTARCYVSSYTNLDYITYQPLWGSDFNFKFNFFETDFETELNYIGLFYRNYDRRERGGNVFYLNFSASRHIFNENFNISLGLNNLLDSDYSFWNGYNSYPFKFILQFEYKN